MSVRCWTAGVFAAGLLLPASHLHAQVTGDQDVTGPYEVVERWLGPMLRHDEGWTFGLVAAVYPEAPERIFVLQGGDLPDPRPERGPGPRSNADHEPRHFVLVLDGDGEFIESWTQWDHLFVRPHKVTVNPYDAERHIWIVDDWAIQIFKFTNDGSELVMTLGEREVIGDGPDHFGRPTDMAFFPDGTFLVSDGYVNARVVKFNEEGEYLMEWGRSGTGPGEFNLVHSVKIDANRRVSVVDRRNGRIQIFDENGTFLDMWDGMAQPSHVVVTQDQTVWISDPTLNRLLQYNLSGDASHILGGGGELPRRLQQPSPLRRGSGRQPLRGRLHELSRAEVRTESGRGSEAPDPARLRICTHGSALTAGGENFRRA